MNTSKDHWQLREKIIELCLWMNSSGLNQGTSGNISARYLNNMLITPSGVPYEQLKPQDIVSMSLDHNRFEWDGENIPSSEWHFHRAILQSNPDFGAVVHTHSTYATVLSMARIKIPACHYMIAAFGGNTIRCAKYATFGTPKLSKNILKAMKNRSACLMANHGMVVAGKNLDKAMWGAVELETISKQYYLASKLDKMAVLPDDEIERVIAKFANYGPREKKNLTDDSKSDSSVSHGPNPNTNHTSANRSTNGSGSSCQDEQKYEFKNSSPNIKLPVN